MGGEKYFFVKSFNVSIGERCAAPKGRDILTKGAALRYPETESALSKTGLYPCLKSLHPFGAVRSYPTSEVAKPD